MSKSWECHRCRKVNSPYNSHCSCEPTSKESLFGLAEKVIKRNNQITDTRCSYCGGYHGSWNGTAVQCIYL